MEVTAENLVLVAPDGTILEGEGPVQGAAIAQSVVESVCVRTACSPPLELMCPQVRGPQELRLQRVPLPRGRGLPRQCRQGRQLIFLFC